MTALALSALAAGIVGFALGRWTRPGNQVVQRQPARADGKLSVQYSGPVDVERTELSHGRAPEIFIRSPEAL